MNVLFITYPLSAILIFAMALGLGLFLTHRFQLGWRLYWIGAAGFVLSQVGHIPFNFVATTLFQRGILPSPPTSWGPYFNPAFLGLSAGLWEEWVRYAIFRWWAKDARSWGKGLLLGAAHGGMEALIVGAILLVSFIQLATLRNADLSRIIPPEQLAQTQQSIQAYWSATWYDSMLGAVERLFSITVQVGLAILVLQAFTRGHIRWVWAAVLFHALVDFASVYSIAHWGPYLTEALVGVFALTSIAIIFVLRQPEPEPSSPEPIPPPDTVQPIHLHPIEETPENLEKTRYN